MLVIALFVLLILLIATIPVWPYSRAWGWYPSGGIGVLVVLIIILVWVLSSFK